MHDLNLGIKFWLTHWPYGDDKCSQNENFHMDVFFHVWVDVTINTLGFL